VIGVAGTIATGAVTERPFSLIAVSVARPAATAVTTPEPFTVATAVFELVHVTVRPLSAPPPASRGVAWTASVRPGVSTTAGCDRVTDATGTAATVIAAVADTPSTVAVIVAVPDATAVTTPVALTVATESGELLQLTARPVSTFPAASRAVAVSCWVAAIDRLAVAGNIVTDAGGAARTVIVDDEERIVVVSSFPDPVHVKLTVAVPGLIAVSTPVLATETTVGLVIVALYVTDTALFARVTIGATDWPGSRSIAKAGHRHSEIAGGFATVTAAVPVTPSTFAVINALPDAMPVTTPNADTLATEGLFVDQDTVRPVRTFPLASRALAEKA
jgi:hypothetical protein